MTEQKRKLLSLYRKLAYLKRCIKAQELLEKYQTPNSLRMRTFEMFIKPELRCSYQSFYNMMNESNPRIRIEKLEKEIAALTNTNFSNASGVIETAESTPLSHKIPERIIPLDGGW